MLSRSTVTVPNPSLEIAVKVTVAADASDETRLLAARLPSGCPLVVESVEDGPLVPVLVSGPDSPVLDPVVRALHAVSCTTRQIRNR